MPPIEQIHDEIFRARAQGPGAGQGTAGHVHRTTDPTHICREVIDNAADRRLGGFAAKSPSPCTWTGSLSVEDDGRDSGWPHPDEGVPVVEAGVHRLHAGGKFNKRRRRVRFLAACTAIGVSVT